MATMKFNGMDEYVAQLESISKQSNDYMKEAVYEGSKIVADAIKEAIGNIPIDDRAYVKQGEMRNGLKTAQVEGLKNSFGVAKVQEDSKGFVNVKLGFDGYNSIKSERWSSGQPNAMVARSINSGTSFITKFPFVDNTTRSKKSECEDAMKKSLDKSIAFLTK